MICFLRTSAAAMLAVAAIAPTLSAQRGAPVRRIISIGHHPRVDGLRLNFRDKELELVNGANVTLWTPYDGYLSGRVNGLALGLPLTAAGDIHGLSVGVFGVAAESDMRGAGIGGIGLGAGGTMRGIHVAGIGVGAGGDVRGLAAGGIGIGAGGDIRGIMAGGIGAAAGGSIRGAAVGGIGAGAGGNVRGLMVGGIGAGAGGNVRGAAVGGIGVGAGGSIRGITAGGIGVGAGGSIRGVSAAGIGVGAGGDIDGVTAAGIGVGSGGTLRWFTVAGLGIGAPRIEGFAAAAMVGAERTQGVVIAPALFRTERGGRMTGTSISSINAIRGQQQGLSIGLVNYTRRLRGVQLGAINIVSERQGLGKVLPIINVGRD